MVLQKSADRSAEVADTIQSRRRVENDNVTAVCTYVKNAAVDFGSVDMLENNAGSVRLEDIRDMPLDGIESLFDLDVRSRVVASKASARHLKLT
jgi:3-oxoacyl-[acyl-carrier protein] reductase